MIPRKLNYILKQMSSLLCQYTFSREIYTPSIAYTLTCNSSIYGQTNHIYVNNKDKILSYYLFMHEAGHVIFDHTADIMTKIDGYLERQLCGAFKKCSKIFDEKFSDFFDFFIEALLNIVMDFEVNSRLFSHDEWIYFRRRLFEITLNPEYKGVWPEDYDLPPGKTWNEYLALIFMDPEKFFEKLHEEIQVAKEVEKKLAENGGKLNSDFNGELTALEYKAIRKNCMKNKKYSEEEKEALKKISEEHGSTEFNIPNGCMDGYSRDNSGKPTHINFTTFEDMPDLVKKMERILLVNKKGLTLRNQMYYSNRRKYGTSIIIPKTIKHNQLKKPDLLLLFDVSGSIDSYSVHSFIETFRHFKDEFKNTKIIFWTTRFVAEMTLDDEIPDLYGGGTNIAKGISHVKNNFDLKTRDVFFIISDLCDDLTEWEKELKTMNCRKLAIDWTKNKLNKNPGFERILKYEPEEP